MPSHCLNFALSSVANWIVLLRFPGPLYSKQVQTHICSVYFQTRVAAEWCSRRINMCIKRKVCQLCGRLSAACFLSASSRVRAGPLLRIINGCGCSCACSVDFCIIWFIFTSEIHFSSCLTDCLFWEESFFWPAHGDPCILLCCVQKGTGFVQSQSCCRSCDAKFPSVVVHRPNLVWLGGRWKWSSPAMIWSENWVMKVPRCEINPRLGVTLHPMDFLILFVLRSDCEGTIKSAPVSPAQKMFRYFLL